MVNLANSHSRESNSHIILYRKEIVSYISESNNYQKAVLEAFRLLSLREQLGYDISVFDQELCRTLVLKYELSCTDCKLECPQHSLEEMK